MASEIKIVWFFNTQQSTAEAEKTLGELLSDGWNILFVGGTTDEYSSATGASSRSPTRQRAGGFALLEKKP